MIKKLIGDKKFYKMLLAIVIPIMAQNFITNFVNFLDNLMVGAVGEEQMSGVSIVNQLVFVFNLTIFGAVSGAGIFTSQFFGKSDNKGIGYTIRYKLIILSVITVLSVIIFLVFGEKLVGMYLHDSGAEGNPKLTFKFAMDYLKICVIGFIPYALSQLYASTLKETGETFMPMVIGFVAVVVNCVFNYLLIFGKFGFPQLGVEGAAIATVLARFVECAVIMIYCYAKTAKYPFFRGALKSLYIPGKLSLDISLKGLPILFNECFWSLGISLLGVSYSLHGLDVVAGYSISSTVVNLMNIASTSMGVGIGIVIGRLLGAGAFDEAVDANRKMLLFTFVLSLTVGACSFLLGEWLPDFYNVSETAKNLAKFFIIVSGVVLPIDALNCGMYFTIRSGGKTYITFLFDSVYMCCIQVPFAMLLSLYTDLSIYTIYPLVFTTNIIKTFIGFKLIKNKSWVNNIVEGN